MRKGEPLPTALIRIGVSLLDLAAQSLTDPDMPIDTGIHEARKAMARARGLLRLVRDELGADTYRHENVALRDAARLLAAARDAVVVVPALDELADRCQEQVTPEALAGIRSDLVARIEATRSGDGQPATDSVLAVLSGSRRRFQDWPHSSSPWFTTADSEAEFTAIAPGIRRVYRRGKARMHDAYAAGTPAAFHEWRKRVKYLRYQVEMLQPAWPDVAAGLAVALKELAEGLGAEHDLVVLDQTVADLELGRQRDRRLLHQLVEGRRRRLHRELRPLAAAIYAEQPDAFTTRLGAYWVAWRQEAPVG